MNRESRITIRGFMRGLAIALLVVGFSLGAGLLLGQWIYLGVVQHVHEEPVRRFTRLPSPGARP